MKFIKNIKISEFRENDRIDDIFFVKFKKGVNTYAKGFYFDLTLADSSGNIEYKYWGGPDEGRIRNLYESIKPDSIVHVQGKIGEYKGRLQFTTNEPFLFEVLKPEQYNDGDFVKVSQRDLEEMYLEILEYIELVENAQIIVKGDKKEIKISMILMGIIVFLLFIIAFVLGYLIFIR